MRKKRPHYAPEFRRQMVELVRAGRSPAELENEFEPTAQTIRKWVEREILSKAAAWFARETNAIPSKGSSS